jgi:hypothetical protein
MIAKTFGSPQGPKAFGIMKSKRQERQRSAISVTERSGGR